MDNFLFEQANMLPGFLNAIKVLKKDRILE